jgi:hypothetical protein
MHTNAAIFTDGGLTLLHGNKLYPVTTDHPNFGKIKDKISAGEYDAAVTLLDLPKAIEQFITTDKYPGFVVEAGIVSVDGYRFDLAVSEKVLKMLEAGAPAEPLRKFLRKTLENPSSSARKELLLFCAANNFLIHEDGDLIAYKGVRDDYYDGYSCTVINKPFSLMDETERAGLPVTTDRGVTTDVVEIAPDVVLTRVSVDRGEVDDRRDVTCSHGLHFAAYDYVPGYQRILVVKIHPKDVVSIPSDYSNQKGRCCSYLVLSELPMKEPLPYREYYDMTDFGFGADILADDETVGLLTLDECGCCGEYECCEEEDEEQEAVEEFDPLTVLHAALLAVGSDWIDNSDVGLTCDDLDLNRSQREQMIAYLEDNVARWPAGMLRLLPTTKMQWIVDQVSLYHA